MSKKSLFRLALLLMVPAFVLLNASQAWADEGGPQRKEVDIVMDKSYELFVGNAGVFLDNSRHIGTLVIKSVEPTRRPGMWHVFTQRLLDVRVYDRDNQLFPSVYGLVRVYFNLDKFQYQTWQDPQSNMSIWYFDEVAGGWHKCVTHWEPTPGEGQGRLWCLAHRYALYGLAYTKPTLIMQLIKQGLITVTPTP